MATGVGLSNIWLSPLSRPIPKTPYWMPVYGLYLLRKASYSQLCVKIRDFSLPCQQGRSEEIMSDAFKCATLNNPKVVQISGLCVLYYVSHSHFCAEFANIRYHGNRGQSEQFLTVTFKQADPQNPLLGASIMGHISYVRRVIANFVPKFAIFRYHGNRVGLRKYVWRLRMCRLWIPPNWCRYLGYMSYTTWVIAISVLKFANFRYHSNRGQSEQFLTVTFKQADP